MMADAYARGRMRVFDAGWASWGFQPAISTRDFQLCLLQSERSRLCYLSCLIELRFYLTRCVRDVDGRNQLYVHAGVAAGHLALEAEDLPDSGMSTCIEACAWLGSISTLHTADGESACDCSTCKMQISVTRCKEKHLNIGMLDRTGHVHQSVHV